MKKIFLMTFVACIAMMFGSCQKELELNGTTWKANSTVSESDSSEGITMTTTISEDFVLKFVDATNVTMTLTTSVSYTVMGQTHNYEPETQTGSLTYTFDGTNGTLTAKDEETGETETVPFTYNEKDKTININIVEPGEEGEDDFVLDLVFTQQE